MGGTWNRVGGTVHGVWTAYRFVGTMHAASGDGDERGPAGTRGQRTASDGGTRRQRAPSDDGAWVKRYAGSGPVGAVRGRDELAAETGRANVP